MKIYNKYAQAAWRGLLSFDDEKFKVLVKSYVMLFISWPFVHLVANAPEFILIFVVFVLFGGFVIVLLIFNVYGSPTINTQSGRDCLFVIVFFTVIAVWALLERFVLDYRLLPGQTIGIDILGLLSGSLFLYSTNCFRQRRKIQNTPTSKIRSAAQGYVEIIGRGESTARGPLTAPLTGEPCIWFTYNVADKQNIRKSDGETELKWVTIEGNTSPELIVLIDGTGWLFIDPACAIVTPSVENEWYGNSPRPDPLNPIPKNQKGMIRTVGSFRYREAYIRPGDSLYVIGQYITKPGIDSRFHEEDYISNDVNEIIMQWKQEKDRLLQEFDANQDGTIGPNEWKKIREEAVLAVLNRRRESQLIPRFHMMTQTFDKHLPFIISTTPELELTKKLKRKGIFAMIGAAVCIYFFITLLFEVF